jgi:putative methionine-R-sulfoxide reductase with GAF domain
MANAMKESESIKFLDKVTQEESHFDNFIAKINYRETYQLLESIKFLIREHNKNTSNLLTAKRMITGVRNIVAAPDTLTAINNISATVCDILHCQKCFTYIYDHQQSELWTPCMFTDSLHRISNRKGMAGYVARTGESLNIKDVYIDSRFDNLYDMKSGFRTKNILALPIKKGEEIIGVLEAINKLSHNRDIELNFNRDDEGVLMALAQILSSIIDNNLKHDERDAFYDDLLKILDMGLDMFSQLTVKDFLREVSKHMQKLFNVKMFRLFVYNPVECLVMFLDEETDKLDVQPANFGLVNQCLANRWAFTVPSAEMHLEFNPLVDIKTSLTLFSRPICMNNNSTVLGLFQMTGLRGADGVMPNSVTENKLITSFQAGGEIKQTSAAQSSAKESKQSSSQLSVRDECLLESLSKQLVKGLENLDRKYKEDGRKSIFDFTVADSERQDLIRLFDRPEESPHYKIKS